MARYLTKEEMNTEEYKKRVRLYVDEQCGLLTKLAKLYCKDGHAFMGADAKTEAGVYHNIQVYWNIFWECDVVGLLDWLDDAAKGCFERADKYADDYTYALMEFKVGQIYNGIIDDIKTGV